MTQRVEAGCDCSSKPWQVTAVVVGCCWDMLSYYYRPEGARWAFDVRATGKRSGGPQSFGDELGCRVGVWDVVDHHGRDGFIAVVDTAHEGGSLIVLPDVDPLGATALPAERGLQTGAVGAARPPVDDHLPLITTHGEDVLMGSGLPSLPRAHPPRNRESAHQVEAGQNLVPVAPQHDGEHEDERKERKPEPAHTPRMPDYHG